MTENKIFNTPQ